MNVIEQVHRKRENLARVLKEYPGIRKIVEELYPDSAHFIYELLQNAEDTGATRVSFSLSESRLLFEHNGRPFEAADIFAITNIGEGTKSDDDENIGRFGIGFKAVFAYTESPSIWSPNYSFQILDLVLPSEIAPEHDLNGNTRFKFPFNNPKKSSQHAYAEILAALEELSEPTLLFLTHIKSIRWRVEGESNGEIRRISHQGNHIEIQIKKEGRGGNGG